jgi:hypothetical protein
MGGIVPHLKTAGLGFSVICESTELLTPPNASSDDNFSLIVIPYSQFCLANEFPRFPLDAHLSVSISRSEALNSFIVFISHAWLRGWLRSEDYCDIPHPDNISQDKYQLCVEGIGKMIRKNAPEFKEVYLWVDYGCVNQLAYPDRCHHSLVSVIELSDCLFTPLVDNDPHWVYQPTSFGPLVDYKASSLQDGLEGYLNRAWCRLEMLLAAFLPLKNLLLRDSLAGRMKVAVLDRRRPHFIYGSRESAEEVEPIELFPLEKASFEKLSPLRGYLTRPGDEELIQELTVSHLLPLMATPRPGYRGYRNALLQKHGRGRHTNEAGDTYDGEVSDPRS